MSLRDCAWHNKTDVIELTSEYIYTVSCPLTGFVVYVGKSKNPNARLLQHCKSAKSEVGKWINAIKYIQLEPVFNIIDSTYGNIFKMECYYIDYYRSKGMAIYNHTVTTWFDKTRPCKRYFNDYRYLNTYSGKLPISYYKELFTEA